MTIIPYFLITGILAMISCLLVMIWSAEFVQRKQGGLILTGLSIALLLFGDGLFPPLIGIIGGATGLKISKPLAGEQPGGMLRFAAKS